MSQENIEFMRAVYETWNSGDMSAFGELYHPDAIVRSGEGWPEPGPFVGREAIMRQWEHVREAGLSRASRPLPSEPVGSLRV